MAQPDLIISKTKTFGLVYFPSTKKGYTRIEKKGEFAYLDLDGKLIKDKKTLQRISALVIPPAWTKVWICPIASGHLQATGVDVKGRKQYRYHSKWSKVRNETKFNQLFYFGKNLNKLRTQLKKDLKRKYLDKNKVIALALTIMEETLIRVGNTTYEKEYGSYGLTTLKNKHIRFRQNHAFFKFKGKKGVQQLAEIKGKSLVNLLKKVKELPGHHVFQFYNEDQELQQLDSSDINDYLKTYMKGDFTCKDFRTWAGCISAIHCMMQNEFLEENSKSAMQTQVVAIIDEVASRLGNTRAVCKKYYIHPKLLTHFESGNLDDIIRVSNKKTFSKADLEKAFLNFLKKELKGN